MSWIQVKIATQADACEQLEAQLMDNGAASVTLADSVDTPIYEPKKGETPLWPNTTVTALFPTETHSLDSLQTQLNAQLSISFSIETLPEQDWTRQWMSAFKPMRFAKNLWICPSAYTPPDPKAVNIMLDPGLAFGTGTHPTTALCLRWLATQKLKGKTIIDYGCGSGILAIAAVKLGAKAAWCVDNDMQSLIATRDNVTRNQLELTQLHTVLPEDLPDIRADLLIANILAKPLISLMPTFQQHLKPKAPIALSGILATQANEVSAHYQAAFSLQPPAQEEEWCLLAGQKL